MKSSYAMMLMTSIGMMSLGLLTKGLPAQEVVESADQPRPAVDQWIKALESDTYTARVRATERLIMAGSRSVDPVLQAMETGGLETISRGIYILRQIALAADDPAAQELAYQGLQSVAQRRFSGASRRALTALQAVHEFRFDRAQFELNQLGAVFSVTPVNVAPGVRDAFPSIEFGQAWRGNPIDISQAGWITSFPQEDSDRKWMLILDGQHITDEWIRRITSMEHVAVLKFKSAIITDDMIAKLSGMPDLEILEFLYTPVSDDVVKHLTSLPKLARVRLIGTRITDQGLDELLQTFDQDDVDYRNGGFLGISTGDNPCRITLVQPGSAAATAGLRVDDVITHYHHEAVNTMEELTRSIAKHPVGERVQVQILREDKTLTLDVQLGEWD